MSPRQGTPTPSPVTPSPPCDVGMMMENALASESPSTPSSSSSSLEDVVEDPSKKKNEGSWWDRSEFKIYVCHIFSSWGDRMWGFAVGLYMVILFPDSLLLTAIYGFCNCLSGIIFGPYIGGWIDKTQRITAARCSVIIQNAAVVLGASILTIMLFYRSSIKGMWNDSLENILFGVIIIIAIVAELASVANKIALEKDWIVVLAGGDNKQLARLNSNMRTINLTTFILAPIVVGLIIHYASPEAGAIFIAGWNIASALIEYSLLLQIYKIVPQLSLKEGVDMQIPFVKIGGDTSPDSPSPASNNNNNNDLRPQIPRLVLTPGADFEDISLVTPTPTQQRSHHHFTFSPSDSNNSSKTKKRAATILGRGDDDNNNDDNNYDKRRPVCLPCHGWKSYLSHHIRFAGLGLSCLYMTVLGFDSITTGFLYSQGVHESFIGIITGIGAVFGILGSLSFPFLRKRLGPNFTGLLGFTLETGALLLCIVSVFLKGSPFKPEAVGDRFQHFSGTPNSSYYTKMTYSIQDIWDKETHVMVLLGGIIIARFGLWIADLSVTQIFQEEVEENQRGIINGVQDSLNKVMDLLKFVLVILLPSPETFGFLIFVSWIFVFFGSVSFLIFVRSERRRRVSPERQTREERESNSYHIPIITISGST